jgi:superfamily II DNA or RNA helicase
MILTSYGYKIPKKLITTDEQQSIKTALFVKPTGVEDYGPLEPFAIYREDTHNLWTPKFFPIRDYINLEAKIVEKSGTTVNFNFKGVMRSDQKEYIDKIMDHLDKNDAAVLCAQTGTGKCFAKDTEILMYNGTVKKIQDMKINDVIMGTDSEERIVTSLALGRSHMYLVRSVDNSINEPYCVNEEHIMTVYDNYTKSVIDIPLKEILNQGPRYFGIREAVRFPIEEKKKLPIDPQLYGILLANKISNLCHYILYNVDCEDIYLKIPAVYKTCSISNRIIFIQSFLSRLTNSQPIIAFFKLLYRLNGVDQNFTPSIINGNLFEDIEMWTRTFRGRDFPDTWQFCKDLQFIMQSIGCKNYRDYADLHFGTINIIPARYPLIIENAGIDNYYGFTLRNRDPRTECNGRFLLGSCIIVHNTAMALNIMSQINKKTLIIVHKDFLANQWIERINQFLGPTEVGRIQGPKLEISNDITIGMLQSISMREYPPNAFTEFGLVIIDECHHIPSEVFSRALYKIATKKIIGLSATPRRKDGLTKILNWFVGEIIIKPVLVGSMEIPSVNVVEFDSSAIPTYDRIKGRLMLPTYISRLTKDNIRNEVIVDNIINMLKIGRKIIVLSDRREHCVDLRRMVLDKWKECGDGGNGGVKAEEKEEVHITVGLYLGGMATEDLKNSESCNVILGCYGMCSEAFDVPTLDTLVFATPRSDIVQSCGRILRQRNKNAPHIIDIVDKILYGQYTKRYNHYKVHKFIVNRIKPEEERTKQDIPVSASMFLQ